MRKTNLQETDSFTERLKSEIKSQAGKMGIYNKGAEGVMAVNNVVKSLGEDDNKLDEKWSEKYKKSIDCSNPKGFSQRAHCQGKKNKETNEEKLKGGNADKKTFEDLVSKNLNGNKKQSEVEGVLKKQLNKGIKVEMEHTDDKERAKEIAMDHLFEDPKYYDKLEKIESKEATGSGASGAFAGPVGFDPDSNFVKRSFDETPKKIEATEATGSGSAGSYETTASWAKSMKKKDWRGASKPQIPGGKFVQVKKKCKKFPYCNQGDIKALKIWENKTLQKVISDISEKQNISESVIKNIIAYELGLI